MTIANIQGIGEVKVKIIEVTDKYTEVQILEGDYINKNACIYHKHEIEYVVESIEDTITRIFNEYFTNEDDYDRSDVCANMSEDIVKALELDSTNVNLDKLTRYDKESITDLDYRTKHINLDYIESQYEEHAIHYIIQTYILNRLSEGKKINRQIKKWLV